MLSGSLLVYCAANLAVNLDPRTELQGGQKRKPLQNYRQSSSVNDIIRESVPHGRRRDGESATADDRSCPEARSASSHCLSAANEQEHVE